jgi:mannose-6-phosphate isomerase
MPRTAPARNAPALNSVASNDVAAARRAAALIKRSPRPLRLDGRVQHYSWGDSTFIPTLIGQPNRSRRPFAELWIGAHPDLPAVAWIDGTAVTLDRLIDAAPEALLGQDVAARFDGKLPFLLKVLAARQPLSIQVHPNLEQARDGFDREDRDGVPIDNAKRNYRDRNHKPELLVALTDFYALRGFRPLSEVGELLASMPELRSVTEAISDSNRGLGDLYRRLMRLPQQSVNALLDPLVHRLHDEHRATAFSRDDPRFWLLHADRLFSVPGRRDRGLFSTLLLKLMHLHPDQGIFLPAGELHSYLQGVGLELMANSNNVLRGGLTPKHVDVDELLRVVRFEAAPAEIIEPETIQAARTRYRVPAAEFELEALSLRAAEQRTLPKAGIRVALILDGDLELDSKTGARLRLARGQSFLLPAGCATTLHATRDTTLYIAGVPDNVGPDSVARSSA